MRFQKIFATTIQWSTRLPSTEVIFWPPVPIHASNAPDSPKHVSSHSEGSILEEDYHGDLEFSEDEGMVLDTPASAGLFRPSVFKSLLHKAKLTTNMGVEGISSTQDLDSSNPHNGLFRVPKPEQDFIPCPALFSEVIQRPRNQPGLLAGPNTHDKKFYCAAPNLDVLLQLPLVDAPVASLSGPIQ